MVRIYKVTAVLLLCVSQIICQQDVEVQGHLKLGTLDTFLNTEYLLTRQSNGQIGTVNVKDLQPESPKQIPLNTGWVNSGQGYQEAQYYKFEDKVYLDGLIKKESGTISEGDILFVLPLYYRPSDRIIVHGKYESETIRLNIEVDGSVVIIDGPDTMAWISLDGIWFYQTIKIGTFHKGGIVFYLVDPPTDLNGDGQVDRGLISAEDDIPDTDWGCFETYVTGAQGTNIGSGYTNTVNIALGCSEDGIAAKACLSVSINGYSDWFLPSLDELFELNNSIGFNVIGANQNIANLAFNHTYWTSSQLGISGAGALAIRMWLHQDLLFSKWATLNIRPIRVF